MFILTLSQVYILLLRCNVIRTRLVLRESLSETEPNRLAIHGQVRPWFTLSDIQHCISRIQRVRFNETVVNKLNLFSGVQCLTMVFFRQ